MKKQALIDVICRSGGNQRALEEADEFWFRINFLLKTGRFGQLISSLATANDKSNFRALVLEVNFAFHFESKGLALFYEIQQDAQKKSSIDFLRKIPNGADVYFELRLLQQTEWISNSISMQLREGVYYRLRLGGDDEQNEVLRLQNTILGKIQDKSAKPIKFFSTDANAVNIVVVDATDSILGTVDVHDCMLATHGDLGVKEVYRRQVFGLFQEARPEYPKCIQDLADKFRHIRATLHGVVFLFKERNTGFLAYRLEHYLMWNPALIDSAKALPILADLTRAIPGRSEK
jgi:hypothetical protein